MGGYMPIFIQLNLQVNIYTMGSKKYTHDFLIASNPRCYTQFGLKPNSLDRSDKQPIIGKPSPPDTI
jgi:hypothetical protein